MNSRIMNGILISSFAYFDIIEATLDKGVSN